MSPTLSPLRRWSLEAASHQPSLILTIGLPNIAAVATAGQDTSPKRQSWAGIRGAGADYRSLGQTQGLPASQRFCHPPPEPQVWSIWSPSAQWAEGGA